MSSASAKGSQLGPAVPVRGDEGLPAAAYFLCIVVYKVDR
jgi:hypothetical protein